MNENRPNTTMTASHSCDIFKININSCIYEPVIPVNSYDCNRFGHKILLKITFQMHLLNTIKVFMTCHEKVHKYINSLPNLMFWAHFKDNCSMTNFPVVSSFLVVWSA